MLEDLFLADCAVGILHPTSPRKSVSVQRLAERRRRRRVRKDSFHGTTNQLSVVSAHRQRIARTPHNASGDVQGEAPERQMMRVCGLAPSLVIVEHALS
jgi:hypothetical protein